VALARCLQCAARMRITVEPRGASDDLLHTVVREGLPQLRAVLEAGDRFLPRYVQREFSGYLSCGDPKEGFAWLVCRGCRHHRLVPFSCKGRGFCPSCGGRRMATLAARWVDEVFPYRRARQWVLTVPWPRRFLFARKPELCRGVLQLALKEIGRWYRRKAGEPLGRTGSITVVQRFGKG
jgi:hypothetical protein